MVDHISDLSKRLLLKEPDLMFTSLINPLSLQAYHNNNAVCNNRSKQVYNFIQSRKYLF